MIVAVKTQFSPQQFQEILGRYDLGAFRSAEPVVRGSVQTNYDLHTTSGRYIFRYYENRTRESVLFESSLLQYLTQHGYPCPQPYTDRSGEAVGEYRGKPFLISEFIAGEHLENPGEAGRRLLIQKAAELQKLTRGYRPPYHEYRWNYSPELCRTLARDAAAHLNTPDAQAKLAWFERALEGLELPAGLPEGICHCDFHFSNILFRDGSFAALLDFDDANYTYLCYDLATLVNPFREGFDWDTWQRFDPREDVFDFRDARWVVREYQRHRPLEQVEREHFFDVYRLSILFDGIWYFARGPASDFYEKRKIDYLDRLGRERFNAEVVGN